MITALSLSPAVDKIYYIDKFETGGLYRVGNVVRSAGGKGINVARVASILGEDVALLGFKAGGTGNWLESQVQGFVSRVHFIEVEGESRTNNNIIDTSKGTETEILEMGPYISQKNIDRFMEVYREVLETTSVLVCSGGLPQGVPADFYRNLIEEAGKRHIKTILDSSNEVLEEGIKARPYLIKPNLKELSKFAKRDISGMEDVVRVCKSIISEGVEAVAASLGKEGAVLVSKDLVMYSGAPDIEVKNTIGSGDSMVAGFAAGIQRGYSLERMFKLGMACGIANTQFIEIGMISTELVEKYLREIEVIEKMV